jgi:hypothetical protein
MGLDPGLSQLKSPPAGPLMMLALRVSRRPATPGNRPRASLLEHPSRFLYPLDLDPFPKARSDEVP